MDFGLTRPIKFIKKLVDGLASIPSLSITMSVLSDRVAKVVKFLLDEKAALLAELAAAKEALAVALSNDASDAEAIATAKAEAQAANSAAQEAQAVAAALQELADADATEDAAINATLDSVVGLTD
jgi:hypothetical protein